MGTTHMTGAELESAGTVTPQDVIESLRDYATNGGDILPRIYDAAIARCEPPMDSSQLEEVIALAAAGISLNHSPRQPIDHDRAGQQSPGCSATQANFAALLGAASVRLQSL